jgi:uncharacterized protein YhaN
MPMPEKWKAEAKRVLDETAASVRRENAVIADLIATQEGLQAEIAELTKERDRIAAERDAVKGELVAVKEQYQAFRASLPG